MKWWSAGPLLFSCLIRIVGSLFHPDPSRAAASPSFDQAVKPLLEKHCQSCHSAETHQSGLVLDSVSSILQGGALNGSAVIPGNSQASSLIAYLRGDRKPQMPLSGKPLSQQEIATIAAWIDQLEPASGNEVG